MSPPQYRSAADADLPSDESDQDLDIDVDELDPITTTHTSNRSLYGSSSQKRTAQDRHGRIALRNLRVGRLRQPVSRETDQWAQVSSRADDADALRGLVDDDGPDSTFRDSVGSVSDDAPLLQSDTRSYRRTREGRAGREGLSGFRSKLRLPGFVTGRWEAPRNGGIDDEEPVEEHDPSSTRTILVGQQQASRYPPNTVSNAKYTPWNFLPLTLYNEFSFFFNMYFLLVALSQIIPALRIGYLSTYIAPLAFVLFITLGKEAMDDIARRRRDAEANAEGYTVLRFVDRTPSTAPRSGRLRAMSRLGQGFRGHRGLVDERSGEDRLADVQEEEERLQHNGGPESTTAKVTESLKRSSDLKVGDVLKLSKNQRVPADVVILKSNANDAFPRSDDLKLSTIPDSDGDMLSGSTSPSQAHDHGSNSKAPSAKTALVTDAEEVGESFIRTDQLDGETDWKLRLASPLTQRLEMEEFTRLRLIAGKPDRKVNDFIGSVELSSKTGYISAKPENQQRRTSTLSNGAMNDDDDRSAHAETQTAPLTIDNTAWANTVLASNSTTLALVVYTGSQTRQALSTSPSRSKTGLLEYEINSLTKILCILTLTLSIVLVGLEGFESTEDHKWYVVIMRFLVLFSTIIPISLRVNLDMGKTVYARFIERDRGIPGTVVRTSTIPEELGRIEYLLSDKTGTLTQNEMELKKVHVGTVSYANEAMDEVSAYVRQAFTPAVTAGGHETTPLVTPSSAYTGPANVTTATRTRREIGSRVRDLVLALGLCHNVTPATEDLGGKSVTAYQASSPDEIAIVRWAETVGLRLLHRDRKSMTLQSTDTSRVVVRVRILDVFPFTSEGKRMGLIVQFQERNDPKDPPNGDIWFYQKGADTVMSSIVAANDWLEEETANMAREGLRTLVVGRKKLSAQQYQEFTVAYRQSSLVLHGRDAGMARVIKDHLEQDLELLGVTGVEDKLQQDVKPSLELLRNAGVKIWMLTGDKVETARCVAISAKLVARGQYIHTIAKLKRKDLAQDSLELLRSKPDACLLIDGESLGLFLTHLRESFISLAVRLPAVIACRCSPTQKADVAKLIREYTKKRICCIGDGGNDVSMIQAADVGVGIVGKEGRQASLAADFSIEQFCFLTKLLVWHGRNSYKRSAKLAQFVIHRGLIISVCQTMFSIASQFEPIALYKDWLLVGYATVYTMAPVFSLVLDKDVDEDLANLYPELYKELKTGRSLSYRSFFIWVFVSIYQGGIIQGLSQILVEVSGKRMVAVSFTVLVINELIMVAFEVTTWHPVMIMSLFGTALVYFGSIPFLDDYFDRSFVWSLEFLWKVVTISAISLIPPYVAKLVRRTLNPPSYRKVQGM
ncbi:MAG: putative aminophospholipid-translocase [Piccolia ochrophora]|nr:MAG: putative aminophospholipid-translocase [Piccolia ochrophora]